MPIYEYRCSACGHELESLQRRSDPLLVTCPACGKETLTKLLSAAGFQLKGSGWYATDFKNSGAKPKADQKADAAATPDSKSDAAAGTSADSKSEASAVGGSKDSAASDAKTDAKSDSKKSEASSGTDKPAPATGTNRAS